MSDLAAISQSGTEHLKTRLAADPRERANRVLPGGYGRSMFMVGRNGAPYAVEGKGFIVRDDTGRELIDLNNNFTTLIHGNAHEEVTAAAVGAVKAGACFGLPSEDELDHADALLERVPWADRVRYANSGTEAAMLALRMARAATGRKRVVLVRRAYHGTADALLVSGGPGSQRGLPKSIVADTILVDPNDREGLEAALETPDVAAVVLDLLPNRAGLLPAERAYVAELAERCRRRGILVIVDEVISFRLGWGGLAGEYGLEPDLTLVGKLIGGGFPVGAVLGKTDLMDLLDPARSDGLEHGGTFTGNPVTMAAGAATLRLYDQEAVVRLNALGNELKERIEPRLKPLGWHLRGQGSLLRPWPDGAAPAAASSLQRALWWVAYERGILLNPTGMITLSTPMDEALLRSIEDDLVNAVEDVVQAFSEVSDGAH